MLGGKVFSDDWTKNWHGSIAVKITSVVMWVLIIVVFALAMIFVNDLEDSIRGEYREKADSYAYGLSQVLNSDLSKVSDRWLASEEQKMRSLGFHGAELSNGSTVLSLGSRAGVDEKEVRQVLSQNDERTLSLHLYHPDAKAVAERRRNELVIMVLGSLLIFGTFLVIVIRTILHQPLQVLVSATRAISSGEQSIRLDMKRDDEFGALGRFFNAMLDKLLDNQDELKDALNKANSASHSKSAFLANMSHELRTPLNAIIAFSEMLEEDALAEGRDEVAKDLNKVLGSARHLLNLINGVLDLSKIEAGKVEVDISCFNVAHMVNDVAATMSPIMEQTDNQFSVYCDAHVGLIQADEIKLRQALLNLLGNAAKFTQQGMISLAVHRYQSRGKDWIRFVVKDNGIGISVEQQKQLFKEFSQGDSSTTRRYGGTGLGLAISRRFCQMMDGDISVRSQEGVGSVFIVRLPVKQLGSDAKVGAEIVPAVKDVAS